MPDETTVVIEVIGEGETDIGPPSDGAELPNQGVVPILVRKLCGDPETLRVKRRRLAFLQERSKSPERKVKFAKRQAFYNGSAGLIFVVDTEGENPLKHLAKLRAGRDEALPDFPAAVGVAHPCIEAWLLTDAGAIARAMGIADPPATERPEDLPAPRVDRANNPKMVLAASAGVARGVGAKHCAKIAEEIRDLDALRSRCPLGFAPFAEEVETRIRPLFGTEDAGGEPST